MKLSDQDHHLAGRARPTNVSKRTHHCVPKPWGCESLAGCVQQSCNTELTVFERTNSFELFCTCCCCLQTASRSKRSEYYTCKTPTCEIRACAKQAFRRASQHWSIECDMCFCCVYSRVCHSYIQNADVANFLTQKLENNQYYVKSILLWTPYKSNPRSSKHMR